MRRLTTFLIVGGLIGATAAPAMAQQGRTELRGSVTDETGGALPGVTVFIQNEADGTFREVITGGDGSYFAAQLLPGTFSVTAALPGFSTFQTTGYELRVGATVPLDIILGVGALEETVTVSGQAPLVDLTSAEVGGTLDSGELTEMPLQNRSAFAAISLLPGIQFLPSASQGADTIIANGQTAAASSLNFDGGSNSGSSSGGARGSQVRIAIESVQEFQVISGQFDAEFGRSSGAVVNAVTKRGTNQWSGAGFSYSTSTNMTSRNFFNAQQFAEDPSVEKPANNKYEFGGVFGGPIVQDKAHFFVSLEGRIANPARAQVFGSRGPGLPDLSWSSNEEWRALNAMYRIDHQINGNNSWALRYVDESKPERNQLGNRTAISPLNREEDDYIWVGSYTSVMGNNVVNTARVTRVFEARGGGPPEWYELGGNISRDGQMRNLPPAYIYNSYQDYVPWAWNRDDSQWQFNNTTSWFVPDMAGDHDFKFGGTYHRSAIDDFAAHWLGGEFHFATDQPFNVDDYSTYPERLRIRVGNPGGNNFAYPIDTFEAFFQDKWTLNERWTVGLGVRWDAELLSARRTDNPLMVPGTDPRDWNNISPRLSLAYDVTGDGRSVIRMGYGHFYDRTLFSGLDNVLQDPIITDSFVASFPRGGGDQGGAEDPGPRNGMPIQDPELAGAIRVGSAAAGECGPATARDGVPNCVLLNRDFIETIYPTGTSTKFNEANTFIDNYRRQQPVFAQFTAGFERELMPTLSVGVDYVNIRGSQLLNRINYVAPLRDSIDASSDLTYYDVFPERGGVYNRTDTVFYPSCPQAVADAHLYSSNPAVIQAECAKADPLTGIDPRTGLLIGVWAKGRLLSIESTGFSSYDGLNFSMEKRYSDRWGMRLSYALGYSRGDTFEQYGTNGISVNGVQTQVLGDLNMEENWQPAEHDRKHVLTLSGRTELVGGITLSPIFRYMSANPFTMYNSLWDLDRNGTNWDPIPAGTYSGEGPNSFTVEHNGRQGGARRGNYMNMDLRFGWRARPAEGDTLDIYFDLINVFNRPNFFVASWANGNQNDSNFSRYTLLRSNGIPRQANFGIRYGF